MRSSVLSVSGLWISEMDGLVFVLQHIVCQCVCNYRVLLHHTTGLVILLCVQAIIIIIIIGTLSLLCTDVNMALYVGLCSVWFSLQIDWLIIVLLCAHKCMCIKCRAATDLWNKWFYFRVLQWAFYTVVWTHHQLNAHSEGRKT